MEPAMETPCQCRRCLQERDERINGVPVVWRRMIVCPNCGDKRCPHAEDHANPCPNPTKRIDAHPSLAFDIRGLAIHMDRIAYRMENEGIGETLDHALELRGAAAIARTWADGLESCKLLNPE